jgi:hypothetical protein
MEFLLDRGHAALQDCELGRGNRARPQGHRSALRDRESELGFRLLAEFSRHGVGWHAATIFRNKGFGRPAQFGVGMVEQFGSSKRRAAVAPAGPRRLKVMPQRLDLNGVERSGYRLLRSV